MNSCHFKLNHIIKKPPGLFTNAAVLFFIILFTDLLLTASQRAQVGARSAALGGAMAADPWGGMDSIPVNPALCGIGGPGFVLSGSWQRPFGIELYHHWYGAAMASLQNTAFAVTGDGILLENYRDEYFLLTHGFTLPANIYIGSSYQYHHSLLADVVQHSFNASLGTAVSFRRDVIFAMAGRNLIYPYGSPKRSREAPAILSAGLSTTLMKPFLFLFELDYDLENGYSFRLGQEMAIARVLYLRTGVVSNPVTWSAGIGFSRRPAVFDWGVTWNPRLGITHVFSGGLLFPKERISAYNAAEPVRTRHTRDRDDDDEKKKFVRTSPHAILDLNSAGLEELQSLLDSPELAQRVINKRELQPFFRTAELTRVPGITETRLMEIENHVRVIISSNAAPAVAWLALVEASELIDMGLSVKGITGFLFRRELLGHFSTAQEVLETEMPDSDRKILQNKLQDFEKSAPPQKQK